MTAWECMQQARMCGCKLLDLEVLGAHVLKLSRAAFLAQKREPLTIEEIRRLQEAYQQLAQGTPLQYLTSTAWFWGRPFYVDERVLIPRFDTEVLVQRALEEAEQGARVLDLCTGSGAIALTLKAEREDLRMHASDLSYNALRVAQRNARALGLSVDFRLGDLCSPWMGESFQLITANPPYIATDEIARLSPQVQAEPRLALEAGADGLGVYRRLVQEATDVLLPDGVLLLEIGWQQGEAVTALLQEAGFKQIRLHKDLQGLPRLVSARNSG